MTSVAMLCAVEMRNAIQRNDLKEASIIIYNYIINFILTFGPDGPHNGEHPWSVKMTSGAMNSGKLSEKKLVFR